MLKRFFNVKNKNEENEAFNAATRETSTRGSETIKLHLFSGFKVLQLFLNISR